MTIIAIKNKDFLNFPTSFC